MQSQVKESAPRLMDINILPARYRRRRLNWRSALPWLVSGALALLLIPSGYLFISTSAQFRQAQVALSLSQEDLEAHQPFIEDREALAVELEQLRTQSAQIKAAAQNAVIQEVRWGEVLGAVLAAQPEGIEVDGLDQSEREVLISGSARDHRLVLAFGDRLAESGRIESISINSIEQHSAPPQEDVGGEAQEENPWYSFEISAEIRR